MSFEQSLQFVPAFVLTFFRLAGMMLTTPFLGSSRIPARIKLFFALVLAAGFVPSIATKPLALPQTTWELALGIAGEMVFGLAIGTALSFVFVAVLWAGDIIGQQMGIGLGHVFDPQWGQSGSIISELYFYLATIVFLMLEGHRAFLRGVHASFQSLPLLSVGMDLNLLSLVTGLLQSATALALQLAAPMIVAMLVADVVLGFLSKTVPQINVMTTGMSLKTMAGMLVLLFGIPLTTQVIGNALSDSMETISQALMAPFAGGAT